MTRIVPLTAAAGAIACLLAVGSAQAAPVSGDILGKLATANQASTVVNQVHWRRHHRWWWWRRHHRRHHHRWRRHHRWW
jgi:hypothetical protein